MDATPVSKASFRQPLDLLPSGLSVSLRKACLQELRRLGFLEATSIRPSRARAQAESLSDSEAARLGGTFAKRKLQATNILTRIVFEVGENFKSQGLGQGRQRADFLRRSFLELFDRTEMA